MSAVAKTFFAAPPGDAGDAEGWPHGAILIVDDEPGMRNFLNKVLAPRCRFVAAAGSAEEAAEWMRTHRFDLVILDIALPGQSGVQWLQTLREFDSPMPRARPTAEGKFCAAPGCRRTTRPAHPTDRPFGSHATLARDHRTCRTTSSTVLIQGGSGTGKELVARALHAHSARASAPFVPVNCAALSPDRIAHELFGGASGARDGVFIYAQGGTLFLDEVADLPLPV